MPESGWLELSVAPPPAGEEVYLAEALRRVGARGVTLEGGRVLGYLARPGDETALLREVGAAIRAATSLDAPDIRTRAVGPGDEPGIWPGPVRPEPVGERFVLAPAGADPLGGGYDARILLRIAAGPAFGSGSHPTTRSCLRLLEDLVHRGGRIADVGAGTGILAIASARLGARSVVAIESDGAACAAAGENLRRNGVEGRVAIRHLEADARGFRHLGRLDGVIANLGTESLLGLLPAFAARLRAGGWVLISGVPRGERSVVEEAARSVGLGGVDEEVSRGWWTAAFRRAAAEG